MTKQWVEIIWMDETLLPEMKDLTGANVVNSSFEAKFETPSRYQVDVNFL